MNCTHTRVAADVSRRHLWCGRNAPTDVGGYALSASLLLLFRTMLATCQKVLHRFCHFRLLEFVLAALSLCRSGSDFRFRRPARCALLALLVTVMPGEVKAQTNAPVASSPSNRYLLIVETSRSMQRRAAGVSNVVHDLLASGMAGQFRKGDTLGLWTFNKELYAGLFPLQEWSPETQKSVAANVVGHLQAQKYEKQASLDKVLPVMQSVIKRSEFITVILVSSGLEDIHGTPLDAKINASFKLWRAQQQQARMPFVTVLRARRGQLTDYSVNQAPWTVELPPLPPEFQTADKAKPPVAPPVRPALPPLVISGRKPGPMPQPKASEPTAPKPDQSMAPGSNEVLNTQTALSGPATPRPAAATPPTEPAAPVTNPLPAPIPAAKLETPPLPLAAQPVETAGKAAETNTAVTVPAVDPAQATSTQIPAAAVVPPRTFLSARNLWLAAIGCVTAATLVIFLILRARTRTPMHISLITHSLDRKE